MAKKKKGKHSFTFDKGLIGSGHIIIGLDLSLRHSGIVILNDRGEILHQESGVFSTKTKTKDKKKLDQHSMEFRVNGSDEETAIYDLTNADHSIDLIQRIITVRDRVEMLVKKFKVTMAAIEAPSYGSSGQIVQLAELGSPIKIVLKLAKIPYYMVSPKTLKKYITGDGKAEKPDMQKAILLRYFLPFSDDNEADAFALARMVLDLGSEMEFYCRSGGGDEYNKQLKNKEKSEALTK